ncbi:hypothetical protein BpHYR1_001649 [Brachionus plicatilis]|uniref:Uncharacterized protein n=1 Tax=Brachionus plicatilis TaxID=10195 RepID=A0A3M7SXG7_BRAPC|nr:hypothetical protein BpHYR1_001649 [Brachionus plicatilis]
MNVGQKCQRFVNDQIYDPDMDLSMKNFCSQFIPDEARHGDMLVCGEKDLRSMNIFFLNGESRNLVQKDPTGSGYTCVPLEITRKIPDPIEFYNGAFNFKNYEEIDFYGIEIDPLAHNNLIKSLTNGRSAAGHKILYYFFDENEWEQGRGVFIYNEQEDKFFKLNSSIEQKYLD